jgi:hypothetical protein
MSNRMRAAGIAALLSFATSLLIPADLAARSGGAGLGVHPSFAARPGFFGRAPIFQHSRAFTRGPLGVIGTGVLPHYYRGTFDDVLLLEGGNPPPTPPPVMTCHHREETITVRSEEGGDRQIRIVRC